MAHPPVMPRQTFASHLDEAARRAVAFARRFVVEALPGEVRFHVELNASYDGSPLAPGEVVYPEDSAPDRAHALRAARPRSRPQASSRSAAIRACRLSGPPDGFAGLPELPALETFAASGLGPCTLDLDSRRPRS